MRAVYDLCTSQMASMRTHDAAIIRAECTELVFSTGTEWHGGALGKKWMKTNTSLLTCLAQCDHYLVSVLPWYYRFTCLFSECHCDASGTLPGTHCAGLGGKCTCKPGVGGLHCNRCLAGFYNLNETGCESIKSTVIFNQLFKISSNL